MGKPPRGYEGEAGRALAEQYESVDPAVLHQALIPHLPPAPAAILDVGAGSGRDAAWLANLGHSVLAVEPSATMRAEGQRRHPLPRISWASDTLPGLEAVFRLSTAFDVILLSAVWMHIPPADRPRAFRKLVTLLKPGGTLPSNTPQGLAMSRVVYRGELATFCGFLGVLIILAPGGSEPLSVYYLLALLGALFGAGINVTIRMLSSSERTETILLYQALVLFTALIIPTVIWWTPPTLEQWGLLTVIGVSGTAAQFLVTRAYQIGEASALAPLDFTLLLVAVITGFAFFGEIPDWRTMLGAMIVVGATLYTIRRNSAPHLVKSDPP